MDSELDGVEAQGWLAFLCSLAVEKAEQDLCALAGIALGL